jgi:hypothetical protein
MRAVTEYLVILATVHLAWIYFYLCGTLVRTPRFGLAPSDGATGTGRALCEIVVRTAVGIAITGFITFVLGLAGLLSPLGFLLWLAAMAGLFSYCGDAPWRAAFWTERIAVWRRAVSPGAMVVWLIAIPLGFVAAVPDLGSDATTVYMVYATDWARAHSLIVDPFLRVPYYADNWLLIDTWFVVFGRGNAVAGLTWLTGCLSLLGVYGYVLTTGERDDIPARPSTMALGLLGIASMLLSPVFLRWFGSPTLDIAIGFLFLTCTLSIASMVRSRGRLGLVDLILCGGFFVGMKISLVVFLPVLTAAVLYGAVLGHRSRSYAIGAAALLFVFSSPWYVKNFIQAGDPITPVLNLAIRGADPKWSKADLAMVQGDLHSHEGGPLQRAAIPIDIVRDTTAWQFREPGVTLMMLTLGVPGCVAAYLLLRKRNVADASTYAVGAFVLYAIGYWLVTSYLARYTLEFDAALVAFFTGLLALVSQRARILRWAAVACVAVLAIPSPGSASFYSLMRNIDDDFYRNYTDRQTWLIPRGPAYPEIEYLSAAIHKAHREDLRVYRPYIETDRQYWTEHGVTVIGDAIGPDRYSDFKDAIQSNQLGAYIGRKKIGAFVIPKLDSKFGPELQERLAQEVLQLGFKRVALGADPYVMYISREVER